MNTRTKHIVLSTILSLSATIPCTAMEQPNAPDDLQSTINQALNSHFISQAEHRAQELGIVKKEAPLGVLERLKKLQLESWSGKRMERMQEDLRKQQEETRLRLDEEKAAHLKTLFSEDGTIDAIHMEEILKIGNLEPSLLEPLKIKGGISDEHMYKLIMLPGANKYLRWWFMNQNGRGTMRSTSIIFLMVYDWPYGPCLGSVVWNPGSVPDGHKVNDVEGVAIGRALRFNINMEKVCLGQQEIGVRGAIEIAKALEVNKTLKILLLNDNNIGDEGAKWFIKALAMNTTLEEIHLGGNGISDSVKEQLLKLQIEGKRVINV